MIGEKEEEEHVVAEHFDHVQPDNEQASSHMDVKSEESKPPSLMELLKAHADDRSYILAALTISLPRSTVTFGRRRIGPSLANKWRDATIYPSCIPSTHNSSMPLLPISRTPKQAASIRHLPTVFLLATHDQ